MPSIDSKMIFGDDLSLVKDKNYSEVFVLNENLTDYNFDLDELKRYVKFYVKIHQEGSQVGKDLVLRSDLVQCTNDMFKALDDTQISGYQIKKRLCPDI